ncbi:hypothetical protein BFP70_01120 [Thioclava sp. SK-1]|uniref:globin domain-containing protein n=1 Tax=Thioclava sp. SK-1 TaxID=1889770 RepID=UPI00082678E5|nr:globin domain-containing protein [Thioclava sp. SK-1]OCX66784.1 hypothetical protein BFP70_01120 [Thioclava sp. SK-1]
MDHKQIMLVRTSFDQVIKSRPELVEDFYTRLFVLHPELRPLFPASISAQADKLTATLQIALSSLDQLEGLTQILQDMGRMHRGYGVQDHQYQMVSEVLIDTLAAQLGSAWTVEVSAAWGTLLAFVTYEMIVGAACSA